MIVVCPDCHLRYEVTEAELGAERLLRCAGCDAGWKQTAPVTIETLVTSPDGQTVAATASVSFIVRHHETRPDVVRPTWRLRTRHRRLVRDIAVAAALVIATLLAILLMPDQAYR